MKKTFDVLKHSDQTLFKWKDIYRDLLHTVKEPDTIDGDILEIERKEQSSLKEQMHQALHYWGKACGEAATGKALVRTLEKLRLTFAAGE